MVLTITDEELVQMKMIVMDGDTKEALRMLKELVKRLEQQKNLGLKSHLD
jgi:lactam utilization protein B